MAKKFTKSSRRSRIKKEQSSKKAVPKQARKQQSAAVAAEAAETLDQALTVKAAPEALPTKVAERPVEPVAAEAQAQEVHDAITDMVQPPRGRMIVNAIALGVVVVALIFVSMAVRSQQNSQPQSSARSGQSSVKADELLQSGGSVCANGNSSTLDVGSTNPQAVGMMLQNVPANDIQTPQGVSATNSDLNSLQAASCF
jgi:glucose/arabinose dehydrogenase